MRRAYIASGALHVAVIALAFYGLPEIFRRDTTDEQVVDVQVVSLKDAAPPAKPEPPKETPKPKPPPEPPKTVATPPPPPPPEPVKAPEPPAPPPPKPEPIKVKRPEPPKPKPETQRARKPAPPVPKPRPTPPPDQLATLLKNLNKEKAKIERRQKTDAKPAPVAPQTAPQVASIDQRRDAATLATMVSQQISPCWNVPAGARDAQDMRVGIRITLNPDGSLRGIPTIQDRGRMGTDGVFRAFGESAIRALQQCSPLRLPAEKYAMWQDMIVTFDPKQLVGP